MNTHATEGPPAGVIPAPGTIALARGIPSPDMFPQSELAQSARLAVERHGEVALNYGEPEGFRPLRDWLGRRHGVPGDRVLVTPGSIMALSFVVRALLADQSHLAVAVETPCYDRMVTLLRRSGAEVTAIPRTAAGLDLDEIRRLVAGGTEPVFLYVMPSFHNPTGLSMPLAERERLAELIVELGLMVVEDDPYGLLRFEGEPLPPLHELMLRRGADHLAVHLSSFSKTVAPGLRVGYVVAPESLVGRLRELALATYVSPPMFAQAQLYEYLAAGRLPEQLTRIQAVLVERRDALLAALEQQMPRGVGWTRPEGGYFVWLELPGAVTAATLAARAASAGVTIVAGEGCYPTGGGEHGVRLSFSYASPDELQAGAARLAELVREQLGSSTT